MLNYLPQWSVRNRIAVNLLTAFILITGIVVGTTQLQRDLFPDISTNFITVVTLDPTTSIPEDIERTITIPIEEELAEVKGIKQIRSTSQDNFSSIFIEVDPDIKDVSNVLNDIRQAVDKAGPELPQSAEPSLVEEFDVPFPLLTFTVAYPAGFDLKTIRPSLERLERRLKIILGVSDVLIDGLEDREVWVEIDPYRLQNVGLSYADVAQAVIRKNRNTVGGRIDGAGGQRIVRILGEIENANELRSLAVKQEGSQVVLLEDIASIKETMEEERTRGRVNLRPAVTYTIVKKKGADAIRVATEAKKIFRQEAQNFPANIKTQTVTNSTKYINTRIETVLQNGFQALLMVAFLLVLMLNWRLALLVVIGIPISFAGTFLIMFIGGYTLNLLSLFAMIMALGMVVDDAVVVSENVYRYFEEGHSPVHAAIEGTREVIWPVLGSVSTTVAAFLPLIWGEGIIGKFLSIVPIVVISTLCFSLVQAFMVLPSHLSDVARKSETSEEIKKRGPSFHFPFRLWLAFSFGASLVSSLLIILFLPSSLDLPLQAWIQIFYPSQTLIFSELAGQTRGAWFLLGTLTTLFFTFLLSALTPRKWQIEILYQIQFTYALMRQTVDRALSLVVQTYLHLLTLSLRRRYLVILIFIAGLTGVGVVLSLGIVHFKLFSVEFADVIDIKVELPADYSLEQTEDTLARIEERISEAIPKTDLVALITRVGGKLDISDQFLEYASNTGMITADLDEQNPLCRSPSIIERDLRKILREFPEIIQSSVKKDKKGPPVGLPVNVEIRGPNFNILRSIGVVIENRLTSLKGVINIGNDLPPGKTEFQVQIDEAKAARAGVDVASIGQALQAGFQGLEAVQLRWGNDEVTIRVKMDERYAQDPEMLRSFRLKNNRGEIVDISSFTYIQTTESLSRIKRLDQERLLTVSSDIDPRVTSSKAINQEIQKWIPELLQNHSEYSIRLTGENEDTDRSVRTMGIASIAALLMIYILLATITNSLLLPFVIMSVIPFGIVGVVIGLIFMNEPLGLMSIMGTIALAGIVVNNSVVFVDFMNRYRHAHAHFDDASEGANTLRQPEKMKSILRWRSIMKSGKTRFRPIFLTTCTTVVGLFNLAFYSSGQEQFLAPMAQAVVWGLSFATLITMILIPCLYAILDDVRYTWHQWLHSSSF